MGCSSADCSSAGSTLTYPDILQHNFTILHSNEVGFFAFKREQNYLQNDTKFIVICFVLPEIFYFKQKINTISVTAPSYLTYLFINCDLLSLYKLFILLKILCKIVLRIVKMLQHMEYLTILLIKMLNFDSISGLKASLKFQPTAKVYLIIIWLHANYLFYVKVHMKYD